MAGENLREIYRALREAQDKYIYFSLAAAGAAIGLSVNQTQGRTISWSQIPLGLAVINWGLSFFSGCQYLANVTASLYANMDLLLVQMGQHPKSGRDLNQDA